MLYCEFCKVNIRTNHKKCPLCQAALTGSPNEKTEPFPLIKKEEKNSEAITLKIISFIIFAAIAVTNILNFIIHPDFWWGVYVMAGGFIIWLMLFVAVKKRRNLFKNLIWELIIVSTAIIIWDISTGFNGWSVDFVLPILILAEILTMIIYIIIKNLSTPDYMIYMLFICMLGIIPGILLLVNCVTVELPSVICFAVSVLLMLALVIFQFRAVRNELKKKFHI